MSIEKNKEIRTADATGDTKKDTSTSETIHPRTFPSLGDAYQEMSKQCQDLASILKDDDPQKSQYWQDRAKYWQTLDPEERQGPEWMNVEQEKAEILAEIKEAMKKMGE